LAAYQERKECSYGQKDRANRVVPVSSAEKAAAAVVPGAEGIHVERVTANIGAIIHGVNVHVSHDDRMASMLQQVLHEHGVLFFYSDTAISADEFDAFARLFGEPFVYPYGSRRAEMVMEDGSAAVRSRTNRWHTDGSAQETPPQARLLAPLQLPSVGGDTMWASMTVAFDALSSRLQRTLEGMEALHSTDAIARFYEGERGKEVFGEGDTAVHPVVITDPVTRRKALYVNSNYTERLIGVGDHESVSLLDMLFEHINTPEFHVRLRWQPNMIAIWEERVTQHRAVADYSERRVMRRTTIRGDRPEA
jgi:taurine dioxygenase